MGVLIEKRNNALTCCPFTPKRKNRAKLKKKKKKEVILHISSSIKLPGAYLILGPKRGGLIENHVIHSNFPNFTIIPITKTEDEIGFVSPFYKCNVIYTLTQHYFWK